MSFEMADQLQLNLNSIGIVEFRGRLPDAVRELQVSLGQFSRDSSASKPDIPEVVLIERLPPAHR